MKRALIAGAGNAGLFLALLLRRLGWEVRVLERAARLRDGGGAIVLWSNATSVLRRAGVLEKLRLEGAEMENVELRRWDGHCLQSLPLGALAHEAGTPTLVVWRGRLIHTLAERLDPGCLQFESPMPAFSVEDQRVAVPGYGSWDLLVGADGLRSRVREEILGPQPVRDAGVSAWVGVSEGGWGPAATAVGVLARGQRFMRVNMGPQTYWYAIVDHHRLRPEMGFPEIRSLFRGWEPIVLDILDHAIPAEVVRFALADRPPVRGWARGPAVLVGDAAHPCTPDLGQGTCQALESAWVLAEELAKDQSIPEALRRYELRRWKRTAAITTLAWLSLRSSMPLDRLRFSLANVGIEGLPPQLPDAWMRWQLLEGP